MITEIHRGRWRWRWQRNIVLVVLFLLCGCSTVKVLTNGFTVINIQKANSIKPGVANRQDVKRIMGTPEEKRDQEYVYLFMNIYAKRDQPYIQEVHYYFDKSGMLSKSTCANMVKGGATTDPMILFKHLSSMVIGKSTLAEVKEKAYPSAFNDHYEDGTLVYRQLVYLTSQPTQALLTNLPFVKVNAGGKDDSASYSLFFTPQGILSSPHRWCRHAWVLRRMGGFP